MAPRGPAALAATASSLASRGRTTWAAEAGLPPHPATISTPRSSGPEAISAVMSAAPDRPTERSTQLEPARLVAARRADSWVDKPGSRAAMGSGGAAPEETRSRAGGSHGYADAVALGDGARLVV